MNDRENDGATELLPAHISADFYLWLWYTSEVGGGTFALDEGSAQVWVDDRIALRPTGEDRATAVLTGDNPATTPEARAALAGGKVPRDMRLFVKREDRDYHVTLRGTRVGIAQARLPTQVRTGEVAEILYDRMFVYEELHWIVACLLRAFAVVRVGPGWRGEVVPAMSRWLSPLDGAGAGD